MEVSQKALVVLLAVAVVFSVIGTFWNIDSINRITRLTGYGSTGYVNVTITNLTSINVTATDCWFGSGYVDVGYISALLESNGTKVGWNGLGANASITVRNDGNRNITLNVSSGKTLASYYGADCSSISCTYQFWSAINESGSCPGTLSAYPGTAMDTNNKTVCSIMRYEDVNDEVNIYCRMNVTQALIPTGSKTDTWTFWAQTL
jgi:hypothetical protein